MAKIVLTDVVVKVANVDLSDHVNQVTVNSSVNEVETSAFGNSNVTRVGGLKDSSVSLTFHQDFAATEVEATIGGLVGTIGTVQVIPAGTVVSATNPSYTLEVLFTEWSPLDGSVGDLSTASVTWPANSITKGTA
jgi:hypothetical protein